MTTQMTPIQLQRKALLKIAESDVVRTKVYLDTCDIRSVQAISGDKSITYTKKKLGFFWGSWKCEIANGCHRITIDNYVDIDDKTMRDIQKLDVQLKIKEKEFLKMANERSILEWING